MENQVALQFVNISKTFGNKIANKNVSLELRKGEILAILGENGSGKTSEALKCLSTPPRGRDLKCLGNKKTGLKVASENRFLDVY